MRFSASVFALVLASTVVRPASAAPSLLQRLGWKPRPVAGATATTASKPHVEAPAAHPFRGQITDVVSLLQNVRRGRPVGEMLEVLHRDPFIRELGPEIGLDGYIADAANGRPLDLGTFHRKVSQVIAKYLSDPNHHRTAVERMQQTFITRQVEAKSDIARLLHDKFSAIALALAHTPSADGAPAAATLAAHEALGDEHFFEGIMGRGSDRTERVLLERTPGARVARTSPRALREVGEHPHQVALDRYGRQLVPPGRPARGDTVEALAYHDVGRAVVYGEQRLGRRKTEDLLKGPGPTRFAENDYSAKVTGTFWLHEARVDFRDSTILRKAGVPVYEPVAIVALPYLEWREGSGYWPVATYARRPDENLRLSELDAMALWNKRAVLTRLRDKVQDGIAQRGRQRTVTDADVVRFFAERLGRTAGLFDGGALPGKYYFHSGLHDQNVSLLAEIVDLGHGSFFSDRAGVRQAFDESPYPKRFERLMFKKDYAELYRMKEPTESDVLLRMAKRFGVGMLAVLGKDAVSPSEIESIFRRGVEEGRRGVSASDFGLALRPTAPRPPTSAAPVE